MPTTIIPTKTKSIEQFVTIPRKEYEELLMFKKNIPVFKPTKSELRAIRQGRKDIEAGNYTPWKEVKHELANLHNRPGKKANGRRAKV
ncbi:MAG: hypothetical protein Q8Q94_03995 [bacterium]|nr:hypothetical protein [bacterium]